MLVRNIFLLDKYLVSFASFEYRSEVFTATRMSLHGNYFLFLSQCKQIGIYSQRFSKLPKFQIS
jgi:hypothetical protein